MKTVKYDMYVNTMNTFGEAIPISKKEFQRQLKYYKEVIAENHESHKEKIEELKKRYPRNWNYSEIEYCLDDIHVRSKEYDTYTETTYVVCDDVTYIVFRERTCKPGYHWK